mmetsp:Transcript_23277/g.50550  ORF Transcript_23277/g.50550 Transcript_23277/m.50550 type:complete len:99 (+) Transcript_23277:82-378(+)
MGATRRIRNEERPVCNISKKCQNDGHRCQGDGCWHRLVPRAKNIHATESSEKAGSIWGRSTSVAAMTKNKSECSGSQSPNMRTCPRQKTKEEKVSTMA